MLWLALTLMRKDGGGKKKWWVEYKCGPRTSQQPHSIRGQSKVQDAAPDSRMAAGKATKRWSLAVDEEWERWRRLDEMTGD